MTIKGFVPPDPDLTRATAASDYQLIFLPIGRIGVKAISCFCLVNNLHQGDDYVAWLLRNHGARSGWKEVSQEKR